jgi:hypothetical protein
MLPPSAGRVPADAVATPALAGMKLAHLLRLNNED